MTNDERIASALERLASASEKQLANSERATRIAKSALQLTITTLKTQIADDDMEELTPLVDMLQSIEKELSDI